MLTAKTILGGLVVAVMAAAGLVAPAGSAAQTGPSVTIGGDSVTPPEGKRIGSWEVYRLMGGSGTVALNCGVDLAPEALPACDSGYANVKGPLSQGHHVLRARARDAAGNWGPVAERTFIWDSIAPATTLTAPRATNALRPTVGIAIVEDDPVRYVVCRLERGGEQIEYRSGCGTSWTAAADLPEGEYELVVETYDSAANGSTTVAKLTVDRTAPSAPELSANGPVLRMAAEPGATFECRTIAAGWSRCASPFDGSKLGPGTHTVTVRAVDAAGNRSAERYLAVTVPAPPAPAPIAPAAPVTAVPSVATTPAKPATVTAKRKPAAKRMTCAKAKRIKNRKSRAKAIRRSCKKPSKRTTAAGRAGRRGSEPSRPR